MKTDLKREQEILNKALQDEDGNIPVRGDDAKKIFGEDLDAFMQGIVELCKLHQVPGFSMALLFPDHVRIMSTGVDEEFRERAKRLSIIVRSIISEMSSTERSNAHNG